MMNKGSLWRRRQPAPAIRIRKAEPTTMDEPHDQPQDETTEGLPPGWQSPDELEPVPVGWLYRALTSLRMALGLRPLPPPVAPRTVLPGDVEALEPVHGRDVLRAAAYAALGLAFVGLTILAVWLYGREGRPSLEQLVRAQSVLREAAMRLNEGDLAGAEALHRQLEDRPSVGRMLVFFEGSLQAAYQRAGKQMPRGRRPADDPAAALAREAGRLEAAGDRTGSARLVAEALRKAPDDLSLHLIRAGLLSAIGDHRQALQEAAEIERRTGASGTVHGLKAQAYLGLGRYAEAQEEFERALVYEPSSASLRLGLVEVLTRTKQLVRASAETIQVLRYDDANPDAFLALGLINEIGDDPASAERCYRQALRLSPGHVKALNNLAYLLADRLGRAAEALPLAQKAVSIAPESAVLQDTLGWVYHRLGKDQEARIAIAKARRLDPAYADAQEHWRQLNAAPEPLVQDAKK